jgi:hypothetical protein
MFCFTFFSYFSQSAYSEGVSEWEMEEEEESIHLKIFTRDVEGSDLKEFKGEMLVDKKLSTIAALLLDTQVATKWVYQCHTFETVEAFDEKSSYIYLTYSVPWPVSDRDLVMSSFMVQDPKTLAIRVDINSVNDYLPESDDYVRIPRMNGHWALIPQSQGKVLIRYQVHIDPGGIIPNWLSNSAVVDTPYNTLKDMRKMLQLEKYQSAELPFIQNI